MPAIDFENLSAQRASLRDHNAALCVSHESSASAVGALGSKALHLSSSMQ
jgi:hypothetical protein